MLFAGFLAVFRCAFSDRTRIWFGFRGDFSMDIRKGFVWGVFDL